MTKKEAERKRGRREDERRRKTKKEEKRKKKKGKEKRRLPVTDCLKSRDLAEWVDLLVSLIEVGDIHCLHRHTLGLDQIPHPRSHEVKVISGERKCTRKKKKKGTNLAQ